MCLEYLRRCSNDVSHENNFEINMTRLNIITCILLLYVDAKCLVINSTNQVLNEQITRREPL